MRSAFVLLAAVLVIAPAARGEPPPHVKIRVATIAPDGTAWARELRAFGRDVELSTGGAVSLKYYFGAIAGDELSALERVKKGLSAAFMPGCLAVARRTFDAIPADQQRAILAAAAKFAVRFDDVSQQQEDALLGGLFEHQGLKRVPVSAEFANDFAAAALKARAGVGEKLVSKALVAQVMAWLAEIRAQPKAAPFPTH